MHIVWNCVDLFKCVLFSYVAEIFSLSSKHFIDGVCVVALALVLWSAKILRLLFYVIFEDVFIKASNGALV